ncbi:alpha/beta fold hydrolase [Archangium primigenium]|uniref:alpha/beta fold hydrolase n=1 Tax=[Archangium] primigenium TaxID=2792470 RepID=UPI00195BB24A|nr:alpha/beta hydrolase [Archangium primigenium]MBM7118647.1 alpha/beta hydrolase [Archangium primigenium]
MSQSIYERLNVRVLGSMGPPLILAHGFGSEQRAWRHQVAAFKDRYQIILFDHMGCGRSDFNAYSAERYGSIHAYAEDVLELCEELDVHDGILVGHSVSGMAGLLAAVAEPGRFQKLVFVKASPRYLNDEGYVGGFEQHQLDALYDAMSTQFHAWATGFAQQVMNTPDMPELAQEFARTLSSMRPDIALATARFIFESDLRAELPRLKIPTLVLQSGGDIAVPDEVGLYLAQNIPLAQLARIDAAGHLPHLSAPRAVNQALEDFLSHRAPRASQAVSVLESLKPRSGGVGEHLN